MYKIEQWPLTLYFDGDCPLCAREIKLLRRRATDARLLLVDISRDDFDAPALGFTLERMQSVLHARFANGQWVTGLDATLWSWRAAGLGAWATPLTWRPYGHCLSSAIACSAAYAPIWPGYLIPMAAVAVVTTTVRCRSRHPRQATRIPFKQHMAARSQNEPVISRALP